jgi:hypothetical protein
MDGIEKLFNEFIKNLHEDLKRDEPVKITIMHPQHMASGGHVQTHLTTTVPPQHGPNPYGIASMFKSRYR